MSLPISSLLRRSFPVAALAVLLVTAGCLSAAAPGAGSAGDRTVSVDATGQVSADPDSAVVTVAVVAYGEEAPTARQRLARNATRLRESLADAGFGEDQLSTVRYDIRYDDDLSARSFYGAGYRARQEFAVRVEDLDRTGEAIDAAVANGANRIEGVRFTISEERRQELREQALSEAMDRAHSRAETVAEGGDLSLTGTRSVQTTAAVDARRVEYDAGAFLTSGGGGGARTVLPRGSITVTASVVVTYNATEG